MEEMSQVQVQRMQDSERDTDSTQSSYAIFKLTCPNPDPTQAYCSSYHTPSTCTVATVPPLLVVQFGAPAIAPE